MNRVTQIAAPAPAPGPGNPVNAPVEDHVLKMAAQFFGSELLPILGISGEDLQIAPTEQVYLEMKSFYEDFNYLTKSGVWRHIEFESDSITAEDLKRFRAYEAICSYYYRVEVITTVVCSSGVKELKNELTQGINTYRVQIVRLKDWDADETIMEKRRRKAETGLSRQDMVELLLTPLMSGELSQRTRIEESLKLIQGEADQLSKEDMLRMESMLFAFATKFLNQKDLKEVREVIGMTLLGQMLMEEGIERATEKGIGMLIETCFEVGQTYNFTLQKIIEKYALTQEDAQAKMEKYWKAPIV